MESEKKSCCTPASNRSEAHLERTELNRSTKKSSLDGMISLPGGRFKMGTDYAHGFPADGEGPVRSVVLSPFAIDEAPVTNQQFADFVKDTAYVTDAEKFGWSFVFWALLPEDRFEQLVADTVSQAPWWCKVHDATWKTPEGPLSHIADRWDHPVVHVSHRDASAYASWAGKDLPTEAEWEYGARGGREQKLFPWGDELEPEGRHMCNVWQGEFPSHNTVEDGYIGTSPVKAFPPNDYGLSSVVGNVWEWTADWFGVKHPSHETTDPKGQKFGTNRVMKGGSFLCHESYCNRYRVAARTQNTPDSSTSNIGFRCVLRKDVS
jgi:formylglycine-generating enzyme required for sulfatase activity